MAAFHFQVDRVNLIREAVSLNQDGPDGLLVNLPAGGTLVYRGTVQLEARIFLVFEHETRVYYTQDANAMRERLTAQTDALPHYA